MATFMPAAGKDFRETQADATATAGHERDLSLNISHDYSSDPRLPGFAPALALVNCTARF